MADEALQALSELIHELGLCINSNIIKSISCKTLTCLGIHIDLNTKTLSIDSHTLKAIHEECHHTELQKYMSKKSLSVPLG